MLKDYCGSTLTLSLAPHSPSQGFNWGFKLGVRSGFQIIDWGREASGTGFVSSKKDFKKYYQFPPQFPLIRSISCWTLSRFSKFIVEVPAQNIWAESYSESIASTCSNVTNLHGEKRPREDCVDMDFQASDQDFQGSTSAKKMVTFADEMGDNVSD
ncbi:hypothetical protein POM88_037797 [Heracleum sosnowskyi]|uniref:Uncharacterized protein n=1 Tax=Heracleum sosnowskyi TaxID=360622 RepID=A0AAD8HQW4_9APIA|nr:hypothetical protein POM88_037797 [Heracleum sosnowskyi]